MHLVKLEVSNHDWASLRCGCGKSAGHVAEILMDLASSEVENATLADELEGHVMNSSVLYEPAPEVTFVSLAALEDEIPDSARRNFTEILLRLVAGESQPEEVTREGRDLAEECIKAAQSGKWTLYREIFSGRSVDSASNSFETLSIIEDDVHRLELAREAAGQFLGWDVQ